METHCKDFPFEVKILDSQESQDLAGYLTVGDMEHFVHVGPKKYLLPDIYLSEAKNIYNFPLRSDDTFIVTFPKSGTTMTQELLWLLGNDLDYKKAASTILTKRFPYLEFTTVMRKCRMLSLTEDQIHTMKETLLSLTVSEIVKMPSPRFIKSHLPLSLLPSSLLDNTKVVYVARDPRDVAVSYYHHHKLMKMVTPDYEFKKFWEYFISDTSGIFYSPYFGHVLEAWDKRKHPNMLFLFYEDITKDLPGAIRLVADFLGKTLSEDQVIGLAEHLDIDNFKKNKSVNFEQLQHSGIMTSDGAFIRKGKSGGWRDYFDEQMTAQANNWIAKHLCDTDFRFPHS